MKKGDTMPESTALQELHNLINQSNQELEALKQSWAENHEIDIAIATQCLRTLHTAKGLSNMCGLTRAATLIHTLETTIDNLAKGILPVSNVVLATLANANALLFSILKHGEEKLGAEIGPMAEKLHELGILPTQPTTAKAQASQATTTVSSTNAITTFDYHQLGLEYSDIHQISASEKLMIDQTFNKGRPIIGYLVHVGGGSIEKSITNITQKINENGTVITTIPTYAKEPHYPYAFLIIFTTALEQSALLAQLTMPGKLTWLQKDQPVKQWEIGKKSEPLASKIEREQPPPPPAAQENQAIKQAISELNKAKSEPPTAFKRNRKISSTKIDFDAIEEKIWQQKNDPILHVPLSKIDNLINEVNRLISCKIKQEKLIKKLRKEEKAWEFLVAMETNIASLDKHTKLLQQAILNARLAKAETLENDLRRLIAGLAQEHNKKVDFIFEGRDVELDKSLLDGLQHPLLHLIKNSIDHGIATPEERKAAGKPETGTIKITFATSGNKTTVSIEDDGTGLDLKNIRKKAVEKRLVDAVKAATLTPQELYQFIFIPGFSTKQSLTQTSGRGIGMNTVKDTIEKMHGQLYFESQEGIGTTLSINIPSYLAIQRLLHFLIFDQHYALPFTHITEVIPYEKSRVQQSENQQIIIWKGKSINLFDLSTTFGLRKDNQPTNNIIIMHHNKDYIALHVHDILGQEEIIIRPLDFGENKAFEFFTGHADFGDDALVLIINFDKLWEAITHE
jgi:two-component system chemotaxis sensor kinase CheA